MRVCTMATATNNFYILLYLKVTIIWSGCYNEMGVGEHVLLKYGGVNGPAARDGLILSLV